MSRLLRFAFFSILHTSLLAASFFILFHLRKYVATVNRMCYILSLIRIRYFADFFDIYPVIVEDGALNISLISDLLFFYDPFLLFNINKCEYQKLHYEIINYLSFLRRKAGDGKLSKELIDAWFRFPEVKQNCFGFSLADNRGSGLGKDFMSVLYTNLHQVFQTLEKRK